MLLLPIADPLGVLGVAEVILVLSFSQPSPHEFPLSGLAALGFEAVARALSAPVIGKKKSLAVQALASASGRLHRFQTQKEPLSENAANRRKKIQPQQNSDRRRRKKSFQQTLRRKLNRRRSHSRPSVLHPFHFNGGRARTGAKRCVHGPTKTPHLAQAWSIRVSILKASLSAFTSPKIIQ
jgi:hypothetical protein